MSAESNNKQIPAHERDGAKAHFKKTADSLFLELTQGDNKADAASYQLKPETINRFTEFERDFFYQGDKKDFLKHTARLIADERLKSLYRYHNIGYVLFQFSLLAPSIKEIVDEGDADSFEHVVAVIYDSIRFANTDAKYLLEFISQVRSFLEEPETGNQNAYIQFATEDTRELLSWLLENKDFPSPGKRFGVGAPPFSSAQTHFSSQLFLRQFEIGKEKDRIFIEAKKLYLEQNPSATEGDLSAFLSKGFRKKVEDFLGVSLDDLPEAIRYRAHYHTLNYFKTHTLESLAGVKEFFNAGATPKSRYNRLLCLLAFEEGNDVLKALQFIDASYEPKEVELIFRKYAALVDTMKKGSEELVKHYLRNGPLEVVDPVSEILRRSRAIIMKFGTAPKRSTAELDASLGAIEPEVDVFCAVYKTAFEEFGAELKDVQSLDLTIVRGAGMVAEDKKAFLGLIAQEYSKEKPGKVAEATAFLEDDSQAYLYFLRRNNEVIAVVCFEPRPPGTLFASSLVVSQKYRNSAFGKAFMKESLGAEAKKNKLEAIANLTRPIASYHIEHGGFIATGCYKDPETGNPYFNILRDDVVNNSYEFRSGSYSEADIIRIYQEQPVSGASVGYPIVIKITSADEAPGKFSSLLQGGAVVTRFFPDPRGPQARYLVLEQSKQADSS